MTIFIVIMLSLLVTLGFIALVLSLVQIEIYTTRATYKRAIYFRRGHCHIFRPKYDVLIRW